MQSAHISPDIAAPQKCTDILQDVCHPGMGTAVEHDQPPACFDHQALLMGKLIRQALFPIDCVEIIA